jgi:hypothetical protein
MRLRHGNLSLADLECAQGFAGGDVRVPAAHQDAAVAEDFVGGFDMSAGSAGGFEDRDVVASIHQFVGAAQPDDAASGRDHSLADLSHCL